jgi:hypothetical protein
MAAVIGIAAFGAVSDAYADGPLGDPLLHVPSSSTPITGYVRPTGYNLTGADGDVSTNAFYAIDDGGYVHKYDGLTGVILDQFPTGQPGATGIALLPNGGFAISNGTDIYKGHLDDNGAWVDDFPSILVTGITSNINDVDYSAKIGKFFIATENNGLRRVEDDGSSVQILPNNNGWKSIDIIDFKDGTFNNPLVNYGGGQSNGFRNANSEGIAFGDPVGMLSGGSGDFPNTAAYISGIAYFKDGWALVQDNTAGFNQIIIHPKLGYNPAGILQDNMQPTLQPEPQSPDIDGDGDVDTLDFAEFQACGMNISRSVGELECERMDFNVDGQIDDADIEIIVNGMTGPNPEN